jgi:hypothetical protein
MAAVGKGFGDLLMIKHCDSENFRPRRRGDRWEGPERAREYSERRTRPQREPKRVTGPSGASAPDVGGGCAPWRTAVRGVCTAVAEPTFHPANQVAFAAIYWDALVGHEVCGPA